MNRLSLFAPVVLAAVLLAAPALADPPVLPTPEASWSDADWQAFSQNLVVGLAGDNDGLKASALQMIIRYGDRLDVRAAAHDVTRIYRDHRDARMRRLAAVSCVHLKDRGAVSYLRMSEPFEKDARIKHTLRALIAQEDARIRSEKGIVETGDLKVIAENGRR